MPKRSVSAGFQMSGIAEKQINNELQEYIYPTEIIQQFVPEEKDEPAVRQQVNHLQFQIAELQSKLSKSKTKVTLQSVDAKLDILIKIISQKM